jgi:hypothetical protein
MNDIEFWMLVAMEDRKFCKRIMDIFKEYMGLND